MADIKWSDRQQAAITATDGTVLVSAAAGSGKTAVLVERVIRMITADSDPVDVDRLLIVTFTRAAATEMRQRLGAALAKKVAEQPDNPVYQRQQMLLPQAQISTVHGFCANLLKEHAARAGLPPHFRVAEEAESILLQEEALDAVLEAAYTEQEPAFMALTAQLSDKKSDATIRDAVRQAYTFMQSQDQPQVWLKKQMDAYTAVCPMEDTPWMVPIRKEMQLSLDACVTWADKALLFAQREELTAYRDGLQLDLQALQALRHAVDTEGYTPLRERLYAFKLNSLARGAKSGAEWEQDGVKELRKQINAELDKLRTMLSGTEEQCRADLQAMAPMVDALGRLVTRFDEEFTARKRQKKLLDYNDLEHESLKLLQGEDGQQTPLARELSERYHQIMVDEYQDTNNVQDTLFRMLSRNEENLFMVGDVKQSIYGFRLAVPALFTERRTRYNHYDKEAVQYPATITLGENYRSRSTVTDTVNFLFRQTMQEALGKVAYTEDEELRFAARYDEAPATEAEWLLLDGARASADEPTKELAQIHAIARRIRELMGSMRIKAKDDDPARGEDGKRPLRYEDICILLRGHAKASLFAKELNRLGIPTGADSTDTFLTTPEVQTVLSLLRVVDNPLRDIEMTAVMLSPLYGFTPDEVGALRLNHGTYTPLYNALIKQAAAEDADVLTARCARLLGDLRRLRMLAVSLPADRLLERLYRDTGVIAIFSARAGGKGRVANLHQLDRVARSFEQGEFRGLSAFIRYMDMLQEHGKDLPAGNSVRADSVRIMTVHHSKGLEAPVVFMALLERKGNSQDEKSRLLFHQESGIGMRRRDEETMEKYLTLPYAGVLSDRRQDSHAEELRVWYVAMTRAREKLIMVTYHEDMEKRLKKLEYLLSAGVTVPTIRLLRAQAPADWLLLAFLKHRSFSPLREETTLIPTLKTEHDLTVRLLDPCLTADEVSAAATARAAADDALCRSLRERLDYRYPHAALAAIPAKLAASALSHRAMSRRHVADARPAFLQEDGLTAAQKGTALHAFMQYADYAAAAADPAAEAQRLQQRGMLTPQQVHSLPMDKLTAFFASPLYARMTASPDCRREFGFTMQVPASTVDPTVTDGQEQVVVQGIADCVFVDGDGLTLVDYKSDRVKEPQELVERYRSQLSLYRQALEPIFGLPVTRTVLYSFHLQQEIEL